jgi:hypothetical protein
MGIYFNLNHKIKKKKYLCTSVVTLISVWIWERKFRLNVIIKQRNIFAYLFNPYPANVENMVSS